MKKQIQTVGDANEERYDREERQEAKNAPKRRPIDIAEDAVKAARCDRRIGILWRNGPVFYIALQSDEFAPCFYRESRNLNVIVSALAKYDRKNAVA